MRPLACALRPFQVARPSATLARRSISTSRATSAATLIKAPAAAAAGNQTVWEALQQKTAQFENRDIFIQADKPALRWTINELQNCVYSFAVGLNQARLRPGKKVGLFLPTEAESVVSYLAAAVGGAQSVIINPSHIVHLPELITTLQLNSVVFPPKYNQADMIKLVSCQIPEVAFMTEFGEVLKARDFPTLQTVIHTGALRVHGMLTFKDLPVSNPVPCPIKLLSTKLTPADIAVSYLSGAPATDDPATPSTLKVHSKSHAQQLSAGQHIGQQVGFGLNDRVLVTAPFHLGLSHVTVLGCISHGSTFVLTGSKVFDAMATLRVLADEYCTVVQATASDLNALLSHPRYAAFNTSRLRAAIIIGEDADTDAAVVSKLEKLSIAAFVVQRSEFV